MTRLLPMLPALLALCLTATPLAAQDLTAHLGRLVQRLPPPGEALTFHIISNPDLLGVLWWDETGALRFPDPEGMVHPTDAPMLELASDLATLRRNAPVTRRDSLNPERLYYCPETPPLCLVLDGPRLESRFGRLEASRQLWPITLAAAALLTALAAFRHRRKPKEPTKPADPEAFALGPVTIHPRRRTALVQDTEVPLTPRDIAILRHLTAQAGEVVSKDQLYDAGWGRDYMPNSRALDQHVLQLRRKLGDASLIETVHGQGYRVKP